MINRLRQYGIKHIWHFTDKSNLESIIDNGGILSLRRITENNIAVSVYGGNQWSHDADRYKGLDNYVHLSFVDDHPMLYVAKKEGRIQEPIWLQIDISVLMTPGTMYSIDVSNKSGVELLDNNAAVQQIDFDVLFTYMDWRNPEIQQRRKNAVKSEILIPGIVPLDKIMGYKNG